jgi:hypothetical protein
MKKNNSFNTCLLKSNGIQTNTINFSNINIKKALQPYLIIQRKDIYNKILLERKKSKKNKNEFEKLLNQEKHNKLNQIKEKLNQNIFHDSERFNINLRKENLNIKTIDLISNFDIKKIKTNSITKNFHGKKILNSSNLNRINNLTHSILNIKKKSNKFFKTFYNPKIIKPYNFNKMFLYKTIQLKRDDSLKNNSMNELNNFSNLINKDLLFIKKIKSEKNLIEN